MAAKEVVQLAEEYVEEFSDRAARQAFVQLDKEAHNKGCGCSNCKKTAVSRWNSWVRWILHGGDESILYEASVVPSKRGVEILMGSSLGPK